METNPVFLHHVITNSPLISRILFPFCVAQREWMVLRVVKLLSQVEDKAHDHGLGKKACEYQGFPDEKIRTNSN